MSNDGSFSDHISNTINEANKMCGYILRTFQSRDSQTMMTLFRSLVQTKLDYCSQIWSPSKKGDIKALEMVQKCFVRKIAGLHHMDYWTQLKHLRLYSQERRRERYRIIYTWKIIEGHVPNIDGKIQTKWHIRRGRECLVPAVRRNVSAKVR